MAPIRGLWTLLWLMKWLSFPMVDIWHGQNSENLNQFTTLRLGCVGFKCKEKRSEKETKKSNKSPNNWPILGPEFVPQRACSASGSFQWYHLRILYFTIPTEVKGLLPKETVSKKANLIVQLINLLNVNHCSFTSYSQFTFSFPNE